MWQAQLERQQQTAPVVGAGWGRRVYVIIQSAKKPKRFTVRLPQAPLLLTNPSLGG